MQENNWLLERQMGKKRKHHFERGVGPRGQLFSEHSPALYEIQVQGCIHSNLPDHLGSITITAPCEARTSFLTTFEVYLADQKALAELLQHIFSQRWPLISVGILAMSADDDTANDSENDIIPAPE